ncbi:MAG: hypothetical protein ACKVOU_08965 [Cytophagales bacterium]
MSKILNVDKLLEDYANEIGGKVITYTDNQYILMLPTKHGRYQKVLAWTRKTGKHSFLEFDSKVCEFTSEIDMQKYLTEAANFTFCRIIIKEGYLQVASSVFVDEATAELIKDMVREVAEVADDLEFQITGQDVN